MYNVSEQIHVLVLVFVCVLFCLQISNHPLYMYMFQYMYLLLITLIPANNAQLKPIVHTYMYMYIHVAQNTCTHSLRHTSTCTL